MQKFVYVVEGLGFGDDENAWEICGIYATRKAAEAAVAEWKEDDIATSGISTLEYRITDWVLNG